MPQNWLEFWQRKNEFDNSMLDNYTCFLKKVDNHIQVLPNHIVLDIGSGPGHLEDAWHNRVAEIHGLDISERYNTLGKEKHKNNPNVFFHQLNPNDYLNFSVVENTKFDIVILMSVLQYFKSKNEVFTLLQNIKNITKKGSQILICDLMVHQGMLSDVVSILWKSIFTGRFFSILIFFYKLRFSKYYQIRKKQGLLIIPEIEWLEMCNELNLNAGFLKESITLQKDRKSLLIKL